MAICHVSLIKFRAEVPEDRREKALAWLGKLGQICGGQDAGIDSFAAGRSLDPRKADVVVVSTFRDAGALTAYRAHPGHKEFTEALRSIADWWAGDLEVT